MSESMFHLDDQFFKDLWHKLNEVHNSTDVNDILLRDNFIPNNFFPKSDLLKVLIEQTFWASLRNEEGRSLRFRIGYGSFGVSYNNSIYTFKTSLPFEVANIVKLAPVVENSMSRMVVNAKENKLVILGVMQFTGFGEPVLLIKVISPGVLIVSFRNKNIAAITGEKSFFIEKQIAKYNLDISSKLDPDNKFAQYTNDPNTNKLEVKIILEIVRSMHDRGHGGTLVLVSEDTWENNVDKPIRYATRSKLESLSLALKEVYKAVKAYEQNKLVTKNEEESNLGYSYVYEKDRKLDNVVNSIAQFTTVDGATIINNELNLIAFGVILTSQSNTTNNFSIKKISPFTNNQVQEIPLNKIGGTRHQSAAKFIKGQKSAMVFVVSQDRKITCFTWDEQEDCVCAYEHLELTDIC